MQNVEAAIASKAATLTAKKIAKEVIQDAAANQAANFAVMEAIEIANKYQAKAGFKVVCPDGSKTCSKPIQVKSQITDTDRQAIKGQAGLELDKLLNNGKAIPKWQKFMDWFLPIWLITFAATAITYALDSDVRSLFNEAGYNALVSLGFITPVTTLEPEPISTINKPIVTDEMAEEDTTLLTVSKAGHSAYMKLDNINIPAENLLFDVRQTYNEPDQGAWVASALTINGQQQWYLRNDLYVYTENYRDVIEATYILNGEVISTIPSSIQPGAAVFKFNEINAGINLLTKKMKSIQTRLPYQVHGFWYTDILFNTVDGQKFQIQIKSGGYLMPGTINSAYFDQTSSSYDPNVSRFTIWQDVVPFKKIFPPNYEELEQSGDMDIVSKSPYMSSDGKRIVLLPPASVHLEEEGTKTPVIRVPSSNPESPGYEFQKPDGTIVPEENVTTGPDPVVTPSPGGQIDPGGKPIPEGTPVVTPTPTPSNPAPQPVPLVPSPTPTVPPGTEPPPTEEPFPEEPSCDAKLNFPRYIPFMNTLSNAFPFSIPWDIERALNAAFGEIGSERPGFDYTFDFMGSEKTWRVEVPKFFDAWKPFTDGLLLLIFDVGIMFGIYRFMKGGGS